MADIKIHGPSFWAGVEVGLRLKQQRLQAAAQAAETQTAEAEEKE